MQVADLYCGYSQRTTCGGSFFRNPDLSSELDGKVTVGNVTAIYGSSNANRVTTEPGSKDGFSTDLCSIYGVVSPYVDGKAHTVREANLRGYVYNSERQHFTSTIVTSTQNDSVEMETSIVCAMSSATIISTGTALHCLLGDDDEAPADAVRYKNVMKWCDANVNNVHYTNILGAWCGVSTDSVFLAIETNSADVKYMVYPPMTANVTILPDLEPALTDTIRSSGVKAGAANANAMAVQVGQNLYLFGLETSGGATDTGEHYVRNTVDPVAATTSLSARSPSGVPVMFGAVVNGVVPATDWLVKTIYSNPWSPCFAGVDQATHQLVTWGTESFCSPYDDEVTADYIGLASLSLDLTNAVWVESGGQAMMVILADGTAVTWGLTAGGASGLLPAKMKQRNDGKWVVASTGGAFAMTYEDGETVVAGQPEYGGQLPGTEAVVNMLARSIDDLFGGWTFFTGLTSDQQMVIWPGTYEGVYGPKSTLIKDRYETLFVEPITTVEQIMAFQRQKCQYTDWVAEKPCGDSVSQLIETRTVANPPLNAVCDEDLTRMTPCSTSTAPPTTTEAPIVKPNPLKLVMIVVAGAAGAAFLTVVAVYLFKGKLRSTAADHL